MTNNFINSGWALPNSRTRNDKSNFPYVQVVQNQIGLINVFMFLCPSWKGLLATAYKSQKIIGWLLQNHQSSLSIQYLRTMASYVFSRPVSQIKFVPIAFSLMTILTRHWRRSLHPEHHVIVTMILVPHAFVARTATYSALVWSEPVWLELQFYLCCIVICLIRRLFIYALSWTHPHPHTHTRTYTQQHQIICERLDVYLTTGTP